MREKIGFGVRFFVDYAACGRLASSRYSFVSRIALLFDAYATCNRSTQCFQPQGSHSLRRSLSTKSHFNKDFEATYRHFFRSLFAQSRPTFRMFRRTGLRSSLNFILSDSMSIGFDMQTQGNFLSEKSSQVSSRDKTYAMG